MIWDPHILRRLDRVLLLWSVIVAGALFALFGDHGFDDPFITFRYAANLAAGAGPVYNPGLRILSTTAPLYALLLAPFAALGMPLPTVSMAIGALSHALGGLALYTLGRLWHTPPAGVAAALLYPTFPLLVSALGGEAAFGIALVLWGFVAAVAGRWNLAAAFFAAAVVTRADALVAVACLGLYALLQNLHPSSFIFHPFTRLPWRAALLGAMLCVPWFLFAWWYYGAPTPVTLAAKQSQSDFAGSRDFAAGLALYATGLWAHPIYRILLLIAGVGLGYACVRQRRWLLVIGWSSAYAAAYIALDVPAYFWYYAPLVPGLAAAAGLGVQAVNDLLLWAVIKRRQLRSSRHSVTPSLRHPVTPALQYATTSMPLLLVLILLGAQLWSLAGMHAAPDSRLAVYRNAGAWLAEHTAPDARIGALEVGIIGYYAERPMIDFAGLIQPDVAAQFGRQAGYDAAARWAIARYRPDYLVLPDATLPLHLVIPDQAEQCREAAAFSAERYPGTLRVYHCLW